VTEILPQLASALGREFTYELLASVSGCGDELLMDKLTKLVQAEILFKKDATAFNICLQTCSV